MSCSRFVVLFVQLFIFVGIFPWVISLFIVFPIVVRVFAVPLHWLGVVRVYFSTMFFSLVRFVFVYIFV